MLLTRKSLEIQKHLLKIKQRKEMHHTNIDFSKAKVQIDRWIVDR
jgi:hypothetical protein